MDRRSDYLYDLPEELIAQEPAEPRDASRLLVLRRDGGALEHRCFRDLPDFLRRGDLLVLNDTRVIPARLTGRRSTGGEVELLLLRELSEATWECLARPARRLRPGEVVLLPGERTAEVIESGEEGRRVVRFDPPEGLREWLESHGAPPLPPYIRRVARPEDRERYQTIYARHDGAVAAPTAGLHFSDRMLAELTERGIGTARITLHVGIGTFRPVTVENLAEHRMDEEVYEVGPGATEAINAARQRGGRVVAVGTTVVRTLESIVQAPPDRPGASGSPGSAVVKPGRGSTGLFIRPPYRFRAVDALLTNFHLPGSTLLMLVSAFAGRERVLAAYREAVRERYRFFSYGDAMLLL